MPRYKPHIAKAKARKLIKDYAKAGLNQTRLAKQKKVSQANISQKLAKLPVKETMAELLNKIGVTDKRLAERLNEGIDANKIVGYLNSKVNGTQKVSDEFVEVPDLHCRHKYILTTLELKGHIKTNGRGVNVSTIIFQFNNPSRLFTKAEAKHISHQRG